MVIFWAKFCHDRDMGGTGVCCYKEDNGPHPYGVTCAKPQVTKLSLAFPEMELPVQHYLGNLPDRPLSFPTGK